MIMEEERQTAEHQSGRLAFRKSNQAHVPFDFFCVLLCFFATAQLLNAPLPTETVAQYK